MPGTRHDRHVSVHASEQHTPSTHWPDAHCASVVQLDALARGISQTPVGPQNEEPGHSPSAHIVAHVVSSAQ
jgi:hypothetical protein